MSLTVAIPARDDTAPLLRLLRELAALRCAEQFVVVDDGSGTPLQADQLQAAAACGPDQLILLRNNTSRGPGAARNQALATTRTPLLLYLDADDRPTRALPWLLQDLKGQDFDFCLFQHHDSRREKNNGFGLMPYDQVFWDSAGLSLGALSAVSPFASAQLAQTSNYPWNKIYRTAFLQDNGIGCAEQMVHEDIQLHWMSFLRARRILASTHPAVFHYVSENGGRLTNRTGTERLDVFTPLTRVAAEIQAKRLDLYLQPFWSFVTGLLQWVKDNLDPILHLQLAQRTRAFLASHAPAGLQDRLHRQLRRVLDACPEAVP